MILTASGAEKEAERLLLKLADLKNRLELLMDENAESRELGFETDETDQTFRQLSAGCFKMKADLQSIKIQMLSGRLKVREAVKITKICKNELTLFEAYISKMESAISAA